MKQQSKAPKLDQKFWKHFATKYWEKETFIAKGIDSAILQIDESAIFELLVQYSDICRKKKDPEGFKLFIDGVKTYPEEVLLYLPRKSDKSLQGYNSRVSKTFDDYCLVCDELLRVFADKLEALIEFSQGLYNQVGLPNRFSEIGLYLGNYKKTPFGVHVDNCGVFSFPIVGRKKFRIWKPDYVAKNPNIVRAISYAKHLKHSQLIDIGPGDMSYWPSSAWHVAESDGTFNTTWSLGVWTDITHAETFSKVLQNHLAQKLGPLGQTSMTPLDCKISENGELSGLPSSFKKSIKTLQQLTTSELEDTFIKAWLSHHSMQGFKTQPTQSLSNDLTWQKDFDFKKSGLLSDKTRIKLANLLIPILWRQSISERAIINFAFANSNYVCKKNSGLHMLIKDLNSGSNCRLKDYINKKEYSISFDIIHQLLKAGAFRVL
jgi:hypothetical protein